MTSDFAITKTQGSASFDQRWMGSSHGLDAGITGTLDLASLASLRDANGYLPSGIAVAYNETTKRYVLFDASQSDYRNVLAGFILAPVHITSADGTVQPSGKAPFSLFAHGTIKRSFLPVAAQRTISSSTVSRGQFVILD